MANAAHTTSEMMTIWPGVTLDVLDALSPSSIPGLITVSASVPAVASLDPPVIVGGAVLLIVGAGLGCTVPNAPRGGRGERVVSIGTEDGGRIMGIDIDIDMSMGIDIDMSKGMDRLR
jgi:hypothetical protein